MTPAALILTSEFKLSQAIKPAVERFGIETGFALRTSDAINQLQKNKFDLLIVDCSELEQGCSALRQMRLHRTHRSAVSIALVANREHAKYVCDSGANFVVERANCETEIPATLRTAYGLVLRERGRYNRFPLAAPIELRCGDLLTAAQIENISRGGLCVRGMHTPLTSPVRLKFALDDPPALLHLTASPVWQRDGRAGFQFTEMSYGSRIDLDRWLAREFERVARVLPPRVSQGISAVNGSESAGSSITHGRSRDIHAIVTAVIRGGPVQARCSACQMTITFGTVIGAPLDQERKLRDAFAHHLQDKHSHEIGHAAASKEQEVYRPK